MAVREIQSIDFFDILEYWPKVCFYGQLFKEREKYPCTVPRPFGADEYTRENESKHY